MLVYVHGPGIGAGITTGDIVPDGSCARREPDVVSVDEQGGRGCSDQPRDPGLNQFCG